MLWESIKMAVSSLIANKMRALLTMLGIIVGIASVIAIVSLGEGGKNEVMGQFEQIGASTVIVQVRSTRAQRNDYLTQNDLQAIRDRVDSVKYITASQQAVSRASTDMARRSIFFFFIDRDYIRFSPIDLVHGRFFTEIEYLDALPVAILDLAGARALFGRENAVGEQMAIEHEGNIIRVQIIGISDSVTSQFAGFAGNFSEDDSRGMPFFVYAPIQSVSQLIDGENRLSAVYVMAESPELVDEAGNAVVRLLELRKNNEHRAVYRTQNLASILDQINTVINILTLFISAVAAISLIVGGIGVMNIMLVSVTERTREIGVRKALGATTWDIMLQFITESVILTLIGGILGILFGLGLANGIAFAADRFQIGQITPMLSVQAIIIAVSFSSAVGLFFGIYPARKAARLDPIDALRYE